MSMSSIPDAEGVVVISCAELPPQNILSRIIGNETLPTPTLYSNVKGYLWNLETKYYTAEVYLYALEQQEKLEPKLSETIKAIVFYINDAETTDFDKVKSWMPYLEDIDAEVQLLICNSSSEESKGHKTILNWCVQNQFELVELNAPVEEEDGVTIKGGHGFDRVVQSLQSHLWANLIMKEGQPKKESTEKEDLVDTEEISESHDKASSDVKPSSTACNSNSSAAKKESKKQSAKVKVENQEIELEEQWVSNVLSGNDPGGESFEALFDKFASMKDRAAGLNGDDRKKYAEKVAVAFWRAMGGDEDEINGLDDDD